MTEAPLFNMVWCDDCGDSWSVRPFRGDNVPPCPCCQGEDVTEYGDEIEE